MTVVLFAVFGLLALAAAAFAAYPLWRRGPAQPSTIMAGVMAFAVVALGLGLYLAFGQPAIALRQLESLRKNYMAELVAKIAQDKSRVYTPDLVAVLAQNMRNHPNDLQGWVFLARGYSELGEADQAAKAFAQAVALAKAQGKADAQLFSDYGVALAQAADEITPQSEAAFNDALALDPKDMAARYYLGLAAASKGKTEEAIARWEGLLADMPTDAPARKDLLDRLAALKASAVEQGAAQAPDISAMVSGLAARLKENPKDLDGWQRLIRAYAVLKDTGNAKAALMSAKSAFQGDANALAALDQSARENGLN